MSNETLRQAVVPSPQQKGESKHAIASNLRKRYFMIHQVAALILPNYFGLRSFCVNKPMTNWWWQWNYQLLSLYWQITAPFSWLFSARHSAVGCVFEAAGVTVVSMTSVSTVLRTASRLLLLLLLFSLLLATIVTSRSHDATALSTLCNWTCHRSYQRTLKKNKGFQELPFYGI